MLIAWSGGCDSTLLLHSLLQKQHYQLKSENKSYQEFHEQVRTFSVTHAQMDAQKEQALARKKIRSELKERGLKFEHIEIDIRQEGNANGGSKQSVVWLAMVIPYLYDKEDFYLAYVKEDDIWHFRSYLYDSFNNLQTLAGHEGKLQLPWEWKKKEEVVKELSSIGLLKHVWWCAEPKKFGQRCGKCISCTKMIPFKKHFNSH